MLNYTDINLLIIKHLLIKFNEIKLTKIKQIGTTYIDIREQHIIF